MDYGPTLKYGYKLHLLQERQGTKLSIHTLESDQFIISRRKDSGQEPITVKCTKIENYCLSFLNMQICDVLVVVVIMVS